jgi:hypothetical protein
MTGMPTTELPIVKQNIARLLRLWKQIIAVSTALCIVGVTLVTVGIRHELSSSRIEAPLKRAATRDNHYRRGAGNVICILQKMRILCGLVFRALGAPGRSVMTVVVSATEFTRNFSSYQRSVRVEPIEVQSHDKVTGYFLSPEHFERVKEILLASRRAYHPSELPRHVMAAIKDAKMAPEHDHLNALLDD